MSRLYKHNFYPSACQGGPWVHKNRKCGSGRAASLACPHSADGCLRRPLHEGSPSFSS